MEQPLPVDPDAPAGPAHAHLWLTGEEQAEWVSFKTQAYILISASFLACNVLSGASLRILNRKGLIKAPSNHALLKHGATSLTHAILSLAAAAYAAVHSNLAACGHRLFCFDDLSQRLLTMHAGFAIYEILFWQNNARVVQPWNEMLVLNDVIVLLQALAALLYPCRLSLLLLPVQQMLAVATAVDCARRFLSIYGAPWGLRFKLQLGFVAAQGARALGGLGLAGFAWWWIRDNGLWGLDLPESMGALNAVYGVVMLAGCLVQAVIYMKWFGSALDMTGELISQEQRREKRAAGAKEAAVAALAPGGRKKERARC